MNKNSIFETRFMSLKITKKEDFMVEFVRHTSQILESLLEKSHWWSFNRKEIINHVTTLEDQIMIVQSHVNSKMEKFLAMRENIAKLSQELDNDANITQKEIKSIISPNESFESLKILHEREKCYRVFSNRLKKILTQ